MRILLPAARRLRPATLLRAIRHASTAAEPSAVVPVVQLPPPHESRPPRIVEQLRGIYDILERDVGGEEVWSERVQRAMRDVQVPRRLRMGVYSDSPPGIPSAAANVVTSLLLDPFAEDEPTTRAIQSRHAEHTGDEFVTRYGEDVHRDVGMLSVGAPWLRDAAVEIIEPTSTSPHGVLSTLLGTDITLLILDPLRLLTPALHTLLAELAEKPHVKLIIDGPAPGHSLDPLAARETVLRRLHTQWHDVFKHQPSTMPQVSFLDAERGIEAIHTLRRAIAPAQGKDASFGAFQAAYVGSNLGAVSQALLGDIRALHPAAEQVQLATAQHTLDRAHAYVHRTLGTVSDAARRVSLQADDLRSLAAREASEIARASAATRAGIKLELEGAREGVERVLGAWNGWRFVRGVEGVGEGVEAVVDRRWGHGLAYQLAYESGRLEQIHHRVSTQTDTLLKSHAPPSGAGPFYSPLLMNQLSQLELDAQITPACLLHPVDARRAQLVAAAIPALQQRAMNASLTAWSTTFLSLSGSWTACVPLELINAPTATGLGLLGALGSFRWAVGRWARAQRKFWDDWARVERGLEDDLTREVEAVVERRVVRKAVVAAEGLEALVRKRVERVDEVEARLERVMGVEG